MTAQHLIAIKKTLNERPRKMLGFKTPDMLFLPKETC